MSKMIKILFLVGTCSAVRLPRQFVNLGFVHEGSLRPAYYPNYLLHDIGQVDPNRLTPTSIISQGRPDSSQLQSSLHYFSWPLYDYRLYLKPIFPSYRPPILPSYLPQGFPLKPPQENPLPEDDGIEKMDQKFDAELSSNLNGDANRTQNDDDTVTIDAI
ncbi:uncharacterized protein LOC135172546 isoform X1 [Diachasmimorpha longicaudata]|uniref:uncharacterized protein LOC135172546 isoform X1 n=1 Tax=Diachasmimorpha longicaudata TaxID=58733 RepID=UPI0030B87308